MTDTEKISRTFMLKAIKLQKRTEELQKDIYSFASDLKYATNHYATNHLDSEHIKEAGRAMDKTDECLIDIIYYLSKTIGKL